MPGLRLGAKIHLVQDRAGYAMLMAEHLGKAGYAVALHHRHDQIPPDAEIALLTWPLLEASHTDEAQGWVDEIVAVAQRLDEELRRQGGALIITAYTGAFGLEDVPPTQSPLLSLLGLIEQLGARWPRAAVKLIDLDSPQTDMPTLCELVLKELSAGGDDTTVSITQDGHRRLYGMTPTSAPVPQAQHLGPRDRLIITAHQDDHQLKLIHELATQTQAKLLWLSDTITDNQREAQRAMLAAGAAVELVEVKASDFGALFDVLHDYRKREGSISGMILGQYDPLVLGVLMAATAGDTLRLLAFFNDPLSATATLAQGVAHYQSFAVAARERQRRGPGCSVHALSWPALMVSDEVVEAMLKILRTPRAQGVVMSLQDEHTDL